MVHDWGDWDLGETMVFEFDTFDSEGNLADPDTAFVAGDFDFRKDGADITVSAGVTYTNVATGRHKVELDDTDADITDDAAYEMFFTAGISEVVDGRGCAGVKIGRFTIGKMQAAANAALVALHLDHLFAVDYDPASKPGTSTALLNELVESDSGVSRFTSNAIEQVWAVTTRLLSAGTNIVLAKGVGVTGFNDPTAAAIADAVWDEAKAGHVAAGSFGEEVQAHSLSSEIPSAADNADAVWDEAKAGHVGAGSFGEEVQAHALSTEISALNNISVADILAATIEGSITLVQALRLILAVGVGKLSGAATTNVKIRDTGDSKDRVDATVDADGNRTAVTLDGS